MTQFMPAAPAATYQGQWDDRVLGSLTDLNELLLLHFCRAAAGQGPALHTPLVPALRPLWLALSAAQRRELAACPYLLLDAGFADAALCFAPPAGVADAGGGGAFAASLDPALWRQVLMLAWHLALANPLAARVALQLCVQAGQRLREASVCDLERWMARRPLFLRPRWEDRPEIWRQLLTAALAGQSALLRQLQLRGLQLIAASLRA